MARLSLKDIKKANEEELVAEVKKIGAFFVGYNELLTSAQIAKFVMENIVDGCYDEGGCYDYITTIEQAILTELRGLKSFEDGHVFYDPCDLWYGIKATAKNIMLNLPVYLTTKTDKRSLRVIMFF